MKFTKIAILLLFLTLVGCQNNSSTREPISVVEPKGAENMAYRWSKIAIIATGNDTEKFRPRPTVTARYLGLIFTAIFDAWTCYDAKATPVYLKAERRPEVERTLKNKEIAISYAAYRAMSEYFYSDTTLFKNFMVELGLDPNNKSLDANTPEGIGNLAAKTLIEARKNDGSNQYGEMPGSNGQPFFNYTGYEPVNSADKNVEINRWQPKYFADGQGGKFAPKCLTPYWGKVKPMTLKSADQFRPEAPPLVGSEQLAKEVAEVVDLQSKLTNEQKALVEFMRDGPKSVQQAGHWLMFAQNVAVRDSHTLDQDVKMFFLNQIVAMDAFIACWDTKMHYDYARPYALVHHYYKNKKIKGWGGPDKGMIEMLGQEWRPYSPETFLCPPFPAYVSGHSTISGGCAEALRLFTGSDTFGEKVKLIPGAYTENPENFGQEIILELPTFTETANMAGISRVLGGYHIQADNVKGLELGRNVAKAAWEFYLEHVE